MSGWSHRHVLDLASFSIEDFSSVLELANRFKAVINTGTRKLPALQGSLIATLFFEPSTRTRSSFELAAKKLSADVQTFSANSSSLSKGETPLDTALTYVAMGADILIIRHGSTNVPAQLAHCLEKSGHKTGVLNAGDGLHSHPSQGLLDLYTLAKFFSPNNPSPEAIKGKRIVIVGDILHSRVARSNLWALTACGANIVLCGPPTLLPEEFTSFVDAPPSGQKYDPIVKRGQITVMRSLKDAFQGADAVITLRLQKERMRENLLTDLYQYNCEYGVTHESLKWCKGNVPVLHPGPVNRGVEMSSALLEDDSICLVREQVSNGIPIRMALLYLLVTTRS
ncbi:aspartate carbamoyltransferase catalytic subunit [Prochlorococcus sp. MIT 1307]|uniref:aspartate carbamoyltransferase catalytic subunit n=1 Tax=Prochlorococcus sp. MIT 1307 TaxID=3096219 RepID=UPI002A75DF05|nr:aspartate carbamoyltransferase catalytic subunit [Prochlorococcus sp. MIT 1307]